MKNPNLFFRLTLMFFIFAFLLPACRPEGKEGKTTESTPSPPVEPFEVEDTFASVPNLAINPMMPDASFREKRLSSKEIEEYLRAILKEIANAHQGSGAPVPVKVSVFEGNTFVARYAPKRGSDGEDTIFFEKKAFNVLRDAFKDDWEKAVAIILGHEFGHHLDGVKHPTNYLAGDKHSASSPWSEEIADVTGAFLCYLAGYDPRGINEKVLRLMYKEYNISEYGDSEYPPLEHRVKATQQAMDRVNMLIQLFEAGNLLSASGKYEWASHCFNVILRHYKGCEIYFNMGANALLAALNGKHKLDQFAWPVEQDWETRLQRQQEPPKALSPYSEERTKWLQRAEYAFKEARKADPGYHKAALYELIVLALRDDTDALTSFYHDYQFEKEDISREMADIAKLAIALHYLENFKAKKGDGDYQQAINQMKALKESGTEYVKSLANANMAIIEGTFSPHPGIPLVIPETLDNLIKAPFPAFKHTPNNQWEIKSGPLEMLERWEVPTSSSLVRINSGGSSISIYRQQLDKAKSPSISGFMKKLPPSSIIPISGGGILIFLEDDKVLLRIDDKGIVEELVKISL
jgi:tetratricopeptide (TPR) repeat protein